MNKITINATPAVVKNIMSELEVTSFDAKKDNNEQFENTTNDVVENTINDVVESKNDIVESKNNDDEQIHNEEVVNNTFQAVNDNVNVNINAPDPFPTAFVNKTPQFDRLGTNDVNKNTSFSVRDLTWFLPSVALIGFGLFKK